MIPNRVILQSTLRFPRSTAIMQHLPKRNIQTFGFMNGLRRSQPTCLSSTKFLFCVSSSTSRSLLSSLQTLRSYHASQHVQDDFDDIAPVRTKLRVADVLKVMQEKNFTISHTATVMDAVAHLSKEKLSSALVVNADESIAGIFTARDLLKFISDSANTVSSHTVRGVGDVLLRTKISDIMTKREKLVYCSPNDSVQRCREIMFQCKIRNMPVLDNGEVKGIITMKALADSSFSIMEIGGKKGFIHNVTGRRGIPDSAKVIRNDNTGLYTGSECILPPKLDLEIGCFILPHPFKSETGAAMNHRNYGASTLAQDPKLAEDAYFALRLSDKIASNPLDVTMNEDAVNPTAPLPLSVVPQSSQAFLCVADGVGSWRQYDVDPREFSHR